jgi:hypothetical protein
MNSINLNSDIPYSYNSFNNLSINPYIIGLVFVIIIAYYVLFSSLGNDNSGSIVSDSGIKLLETILWGVFIVLLLLNGMSYIFNINIIASLKNLFSGTPELDVLIGDIGFDDKTSVVPEILRAKQVFHIPNNKYTYNDSKAICSAYGGRLATYTEIEKAHKKGADWCGFGWSENQMALYPTQYDKWKNLQSIEGHEHDCGRPGINGGYIDNPNVRFGINCYGYKPKITQYEVQNMKNVSLYPKTVKEIEFDQKVDYWKAQLENITVAPFNHNNWSII